MAQIPTYSQLTAPSLVDQIPIVDVSASNELKYANFETIHKTPVITGNPGLKMTDSAGVPWLNMVTGGNLGMGGSSILLPHTTLHVRKNATNDIPAVSIEHEADGYDSSMSFRQNSIQKYIIGYDDSADLFKIGTTFATNSITISSGGNVGISSASATHTLTVGGDAQFLDTNSITIDSSVPAITSNTTLVINASNSQHTTFNGGVLHVDGTNSRVGVGTSSPASPLHVEGSGNLIEIKATSGSAIIKLNNNGSNISYITNTATTLALGASTTPDGTTLNISKTSGKVNIGATDFSRQFTATSSDVIVSNFSGSAASRSTILIENTSNDPSRDQLIGFRYNNSGTQNINWIVGSKGTSVAGVSHFVIHSPSASLELDASIALQGTLSSNDVYIDNAGGITSANTPVAFAEVTGHATQPTIAAGSYNAASITANPADNVFRINFTKSLSNTTYMVVVTGYDSAVVGEAITGFATVKNAAYCTVTLSPNTINITDTTVTINVVIYGAKLLT